MTEICGEWPTAAQIAELAAKGACPVCGCEETNSRGLWTCECPASPSAKAGVK